MRSGSSADLTSSFQSCQYTPTPPTPTPTPTPLLSVNLELRRGLARVGAARQRVGLLLLLDHSSSSLLKYPAPRGKRRQCQLSVGTPVAAALTLLRAAISKSRLASWPRGRGVDSQLLYAHSSARRDSERKNRGGCLQKMTASMTRWFNSPPTSLAT